MFPYDDVIMKWLVRTSEIMTSWHTGPLCGESTGHRWIPFTKASNAKMWCCRCVLRCHITDQDWFSLSSYWTYADLYMMTSSNGNIYHVTGPITKASDAEFWMLSLIYAFTNGWANNRDAGDSRQHRTHYDVPFILSFVYTAFRFHMACLTHSVLVTRNWNGSSLFQVMDCPLLRTKPLP